jgi:hypothetical protein
MRGTAVADVEAKGQELRGREGQVGVGSELADVFTLCTRIDGK